MTKYIAIALMALTATATADDCFQEPTPSKGGIGSKAAYYVNGGWVYPFHTGLVAWQGTTPRDILIQFVGTMKDDPATPTINESGQPYLLSSGLTPNSLGASSTALFRRCPNGYDTIDLSRFTKVELVLFTFAPGTQITAATKPIEWARVSMQK